MRKLIAVFILIGLGVIVLASFPGFRHVFGDQKYTDERFGISLTKPWNWNAEYTERNGLIVISSQQNIFQKSSGRIEIWGITCVQPTIEDPEELLRTDVVRFLRNYKLNPDDFVYKVSINQSANAVIYGSDIEIPTTVFPDGSLRNQMINNLEGTLQPIQIAVIQNSLGHMIVIQWFLSDDERLNAEGEKIIESIEFRCSE